MACSITSGKFANLQSVNLYYSSNLHILSQSQYFPPKSAMFNMLDLNQFAIVRDMLFLPSEHEKSYVTPSYCKKLTKEEVYVVLSDPRTIMDPVTEYCLKIIFGRE